MSSSSYLSACRSISRKPLTTLVKIFETKKFDKNFRISYLNTKKDLKGVAEADTAFSQQVVGVLTTSMQSRKVDGSVFTVAVMHLFLLFRAGREQVHQVQRASTAMQT